MPPTGGEKKSLRSPSTDVDDLGTAWWGEPVSMRWVLIHMVEEVARHAGHIDILRELIDGRTGDHNRDE